MNRIEETIKRTSREVEEIETDTSEYLVKHTVLHNRMTGIKITLFLIIGGVMLETRGARSGSDCPRYSLYRTLESAMYHALPMYNAPARA